MARTRFDASSRYVLDKGGVTASRREQNIAQYRIHTVVDGDSIWNLAHRLLGNSARWWEIADLNPQLLFSSPEGSRLSKLEPGTNIRVPA